MKKKSLNFEDLDYTELEDIQGIESEGEIIKVWVRYIVPEELYQEEDYDGKYKAKTHALLKDQYGSYIKTTEFSKKTYFKLRDFEEIRKSIEVLAEVIKIKKGKGFKNILKIRKFRSGDLPIRQIQATREEIKLVQKFLVIIAREFTNGNRWGLLYAIKEAAIERYNIAGTDIDEPFNDIIDAMICQALSGGSINNTNGRIHTCIIGHPSMGKKLFVLIAKLINVVFQEAQGARVTEAGLTAGMSKQLPIGSIPLANKGVFCLPDFDKCKIKEELLPIFNDVMEDAKCIITGIYKTELEAETAIHIDINRQSDLYPDESISKNLTEDIGLPTSIISRFDFIIELHEDLDLQYKKVEQLFTSSPNRNKKGKSKIAVFCRKNGIEFDRFIKLIVAYVTTEFQNINRDPVKIYMWDRFSEIITTNEDGGNMSGISMFLMRLLNSYYKINDALTRIQLLIGVSTEN